jgi:hypothetical protein
MATDHTADEVRDVLDKMEERFEDNGRMGDFEAFETYIEAVVEDGTMWPNPELNVTYELDAMDRLSGEKDAPVGGWISMGIMLGTALERDVPIDTDEETAYRDGDFTLPDE